jgi:hypothetical protein
MASDIRRDEFLITVTASGQFGWQASVTSPDGAVQFVFGPALPPIGDGSARLFTGTNGDLSAELRQTGFSGTPLEQLVDLRYWTYDVINNASHRPRQHRQRHRQLDDDSSGRSWVPVRNVGAAAGGDERSVMRRRRCPCGGAPPRLPRR